MAGLEMDAKARIRFLAKVAPPNADGCRLWLACTSDGYGQFRLDGRLVLAHRVSYELFVGAIPDGLQLDHLCRVRNCAAPEHLEPVTSRENSMRSPISLAALQVARTHCPQGHAYEGDNLYMQSSGSRVCRECGRAYKAANREAINARARARYAANRAAAVGG